MRYKQTIFGVAWVVIQPLATSLLFAAVFTSILGTFLAGVPVVLFVYAALLPWNLFAKGLSEGSTSLVANERLVTRVYFPRLVLPASVILSESVDFVVGFAVLVGLMFYFGVMPTIVIFLLPFFVLLTFLCSMGTACLFSAIDARYRDARVTLPFLSTLLFFATPIFYPLKLVSPTWHTVYALNPMVAVVEGFRWALLGTPSTLEPHLIALSIAISVVLFVTGVFYFRRAERIFADTV